MALTPTTPGTEKAAKRQAAEQDVFLREVDDALRQDQVEGFYRNYGKLVLGVVFVGLVGFAGFLFWQHRTDSARERAAEQLVQAIDAQQNNKLGEAKSKLDALVAEDGDHSLAKLMQAGIALEQNRKADAIKIYKAIAADSGTPEELRNLASVREVAASFDSMPPQAVIDRLKPLAAPGNAWFGVAGELVAMAYLKQNKPDQAGQLLAAIAKDKDVSTSLRNRAGQLAGVLGADSLEDVVDERGQPLDESKKAADAANGAAAGENDNG